MGLIKKPKKKRHHVVRDPYAIALRKAEKKQVRRNRRVGPDDQEVSRTDRTIMQFMMSMSNPKQKKKMQQEQEEKGKRKRGGPDRDNSATYPGGQRRSDDLGAGTSASVDDERSQQQKNKKRNKRKGKLLDSTSMREAVEPYQPGMEKPLKPVPVYRQKPGEADRDFMRRIQRTTDEVLEQCKFEDKYEVDVWQDPETGKVDLKSRKAANTFANDVEAELAAMKTMAEADPSIKKHVKFGREVRVTDHVKKAETDDPDKANKASGKAKGKKAKQEKRLDQAARKVVKERNRCKLLKARKRLRRIGGKGSKASQAEEEATSALMKVDNVAFGEVVSCPPLLEHRPRKAQEHKTNRPGRKDLLLKDLFNKKRGSAEGKKPGVSGANLSNAGDKKASGKGSSFKDAMRKRELEQEREKVLSVYRQQKRLKLSNEDPC